MLYSRFPLKEILKTLLKLKFMLALILLNKMCCVEIEISYVNIIVIQRAMNFNFLCVCSSKQTSKNISHNNCAKSFSIYLCLTDIFSLLGFWGINLHLLFFTNYFKNFFVKLISRKKHFIFVFC